MILGPVRAMGAGMVVMPCAIEVAKCVTCRMIFIIIIMIILLVSCPSLTDPNNGTINCSLEDYGAPSYKDTCSFTCNTGYELTGSDIRTCQSDGSWSGSDVVCSNNTATMSAYIIIGAVLASLFVLLIFVILICGIMLVKNRRKHQLHRIAIYGKGIHVIMYM